MVVIHEKITFHIVIIYNGTFLKHCLFNNIGLLREETAWYTSAYNEGDNEVTLKEVGCEGVDSMKWFRTGSTDGLT